MSVFVRSGDDYIVDRVYSEAERAKESKGDGSEAASACAKRASPPNSQYPHQSRAIDVISVGHTQAGQTT